jgi:hypothetical protein
MSVDNDIFISYSHDDRNWLDRLQKTLKPLLRNKSISVWDDTKIRTGAKWKGEIEKALNDAEAAILLVSQNFLASDFITKEEVPQLLGSAQTKGLKIIWVPISDCLWQETDIANYQSAYPPDTPLDSLQEWEVNKALVKICREIKQALYPEPEPETNPEPEPEPVLQPPLKKAPDIPSQTPPPPPPPLPQQQIAHFAGTWRSLDGSFTVIQQNGATITGESFANVFGIATKVAWGQGTVIGRQAYFDFMDAYGNSGRTDITLAEDGQSIVGVARYNNGFVQNTFASRSA